MVTHIPAQSAAPIKLSLRDAEALALKNHPQVQAALFSSAAMSQRVDAGRAAYYPVLAGDITGSQGNPQGRIGAGALTDSRIFNRIGQGITVNQLISDFGRTPNLVATSRLQANAAEQVPRPQDTTSSWMSIGPTSECYARRRW
jgi:outer membrane protein